MQRKAAPFLHVWKRYDPGFQKRRIFSAVGGKDKRPAAKKFQNHGGGRLFRSGIQSRERLVHDENVRRGEKCPKERRPPLHAAGKF